jgi:2,3-bisphosphoglycerate-dependent phosphoglycerate mutase
MAILVLVRHGESEYNKLGLWTGWTDISLTLKGHEEAKNTGKKLLGIHFDYAFTSNLIRTKQTLNDILEVLGQNPQIISNKALNERDYGDFTGQDKWKIKENLGEEKFHEIRRSWDIPPPNGESLKMVYEREIPYYNAEIEPKLKQGKNVIVVAHGNSLRALVKYLENVPDTQIASLEIATGEAYVYKVNENGEVTSKEIKI